MFVPFCYFLLLAGCYNVTIIFYCLQRLITFSSLVDEIQHPRNIISMYYYVIEVQHKTFSMRNYSIVLCILEVKDSKPKKLVFKEKRTGFCFILIRPFILL